MDGVEFSCWQCDKPVWVCQSCWRGQRYCSTSCQHEGKHSYHRLRQARYALTRSGRESQRRRSRRQRLKKNATDATTKPKPNRLKPLLTPAVKHCRFCGKKLLVAALVQRIHPVLVATLSILTTCAPKPTIGEPKLPTKENTASPRKLSACILKLKNKNS